MLLLLRCGCRATRVLLPVLLLVAAEGVSVWLPCWHRPAVDLTGRGLADGSRLQVEEQQEDGQQAEYGSSSSSTASGRRERTLWGASVQVCPVVSCHAVCALVNSVV